MTTRDRPKTRAGAAAGLVEGRSASLTNLGRRSIDRDRVLVDGVVAIALLWSVLKRFEPASDDRHDSAHTEASREPTTV